MTTEPINEAALSMFEACPVCGSTTRMELVEDWQDRVGHGEAIPIVGCGNPWHVGLGEPKSPHAIRPGFMLEHMRRTGLLEGDELGEVWERVLRDRVIGELLVERHGVVAGRDGDRIYLRRINGDGVAVKHGPWHARVVELQKLLVDATKVQRDPCDHSGIGRPGCISCDPRLRDELGVGQKAEAAGG